MCSLLPPRLPLALYARPLLYAARGVSGLGEPVTGMDGIELGADRTLQLVVRPEAALRTGRHGRNLSRDEENGPGTRRSGGDQHPLDDRAARQFELPARSKEHESGRSRSEARGLIRVAAEPRLDARRGLYLHGTREARRARACRDKKIVPYDKVLQSYRVDVDYKTGSAHKRPSSGPIEDKVYFFRYLILHDDLVSFASQPMSEARYAALAALLASSAPGEERS